AHDADMDQFRNLTKQLDQLPQTAAPAAKPSTRPAAFAAGIGQADLERSMADFDRDLAAARIALKDHPEYQAYVDAATQMESKTRDLTNKLVQRRQDWQEQLDSLKRLMDQETSDRQAAKFNADDKLKS